jgi:PKD domain
VTVTGGLALLGNFTGSGSFTDADLAGPEFTATVNYGDGTGTHSLPLAGTTFRLSHHYTALVGSYQVTVTVTDNDGVSGKGTATVTVALGL